MKHFEYKIFDVDSAGGDFMESMLNDLGKERWEMISVTDITKKKGDNSVRFYLKREYRI